MFKKVVIRKITESKAKKEIGKFLIRSLSKGVHKVDVSEVALNLKLPGTQVENIFYEFIKEGRAKEL